MKSLSKKMLSLAVMMAVIPQVSASAATLDQYNLDEFLVLGSSVAKEMDTPATTEVFTKEDLKMYNGSNAQEILEYATGAIAAQPTGVGSTFGMRGLTGPSRNPTILIDGVPLNMAGFANLDAIPVNAIERVEIMRGTGAVLYGTDTFTGVINIITKESNEKSLSGGFGSRGKRLGTLTYSEDNFGVAYTHDRIAERNWYTDSKTSKGTWMEKNSVMLKYAPSDNLSLRYMLTDNENDYDKYNKKTHLNEGECQTNIQFQDINASYDNKGLKVTVFGQQRKYENDKYDLDKIMQKADSLRRKSYNYGVDANYNFQLGNFDIIAGGEYALEADSHGNVKGDTSFDLDMIKRHRKALYFQATSDVSNKTQISFGAREAMYDDLQNEFLPSFQVLHKLDKNDSLFMNINKSFRVPTIGDQYSDDEDMIFNDDLSPETGWNYEIGWKKLLSDKEFMKLSVYHLDIDDRIYTEKIDDEHSMVVNATKFKNTGVELSYEGQISDKFKVRTAVAYSDPKQFKNPGDDYKNCDDKLLINSSITYRDGKFTGNLLHQYAALRHNAFGDDTAKGIKQYLNFNATYSFDKDNSVKFGINNILNRTEEMQASRGTLLPYRDWFVSYERHF